MDRTFLIVVGAPRSGTTWLHHMLAAHPAVAAIEEELTVFTRYVGTWSHNFQAERKDMDAGRWRQGLATLWTERELDDFLTRFVHDVYGRVLQRNPAATHIVDKHPNYANHLQVVDRYLPQSRVIHIIRDGREVAVSMMSANRRTGMEVGRDARGSAHEWHRYVTNAQEYGARLGPARYLEVRYERLMEHTADELERIAAFCGLPVSKAEAEKIAADHHISRKQVSKGDEGNNALRASPGAIWKKGLDLRQRYTFDRVAGALLLRLGYARRGWWAFNPLQRMAMLPYGLLLRSARSARALTRIWSTPIEERLP